MGLLDTLSKNARIIWLMSRKDRLQKELQDVDRELEVLRRK